MRSMRTLIQEQSGFMSLENVLPTDSSYATTAVDIVVKASAFPGRPPRILDLGCGTGETLEMFEKVFPSCTWYGVDIEDSPEVRSRTKTEGNFATFDGVTLPYDDDYFDLIYCRQVFEHVRHPDELAKQIARVLKSDGRFIGSVSFLEPYHSFSMFNFTPLAVCRVFGDAGLKVDCLRPSTDCFFLIFRQLINRSRKFDFLSKYSLIYALLEIGGRILRLNNKQISYLKLQFAGHITFEMRK